MKKAKESDSVVQLNLKITNCNLFFIAENNRTYTYICDLLFISYYYLFISKNFQNGIIYYLTRMTLD